MNGLQQQKVTAEHLKRDAYLYVRQSTLRQVCENTESKERQYGLRQRAVALGWPLERIIVIDQDLGQSGASAVDRKGFQRLVAEVGMGRVGIVLGLEVSRSVGKYCGRWCGSMRLVRAPLIRSSSRCMATSLSNRWMWATYGLSS